MAQALRPYQVAAIDSVWTYLREKPGNPVVCLPTASGKTPVLVELSRQAIEQWNGRVLILSHVRELLSQAKDKFMAWWPMAPVGVYSAGLKSRDTQEQIIIAGVQSVYRRARELGKFDLVIVDEAHLIPATGEGMYLSLLADLKAINPAIRVTGLTATPYRLDSGMICGNDNILTEVCYEAGIKDLMDQGFLCKLRGKSGHEADISAVHTRGGDYIPGELEAAVTDEWTVKLAVDDCQKYLADRKAWVLFCTGVKHAEMVHAELTKRGFVGAVVTGETPSGLRDEYIAKFKSGEFRYLCNINVLSLGFDAPHIDAVIMLRPTQSPGLYYQQVGRGLRLHESKTDTLVLDLAGNIRTHGAIHQIEIKEKKEKSETKVCPKCAEIIECGIMVCSACGYEFPQPPAGPRTVANHDTKADDVDPMGSRESIVTWPVTDVEYQVWLKKGAPPTAPKTLRVTYYNGFNSMVSEWVCFEHQGYAHQKAIAWWKLRSNAPMPATSKDAQEFILANPDQFHEATSIRVKLGGKYPELVKTNFFPPCESCIYFDGTHCHRHGEDVPADWQTAGCDSWNSAVENSTDTSVGIPPDPSVPF